MDHVLSVTVSNSSTDIKHVTTSALLRVVRLLRQVFEQLLALNILHDQVNELVVIVGLVVLNDVGVIQFVQHIHFLHHEFDVVLELVFVEHFNCDKHVRLVL